jgi:hypothetical protein
MVAISAMACLLAIAACAPAPSPAAPIAPATTAPPSRPQPVVTASASAIVDAGPPPEIIVTYPHAPVPVRVEGGKEYWGVYLATFDKNDDAYDRALAAYEKAKLVVSSGELVCDRGASDAGIHGAWEIVVYFASEADARAFAAEVSPTPVGIAKVTIGCAD